jgi:hypothetical protein
MAAQEQNQFLEFLFRLDFSYLRADQIRRIFTFKSVNPVDIGADNDRTILGSPVMIEHEVAEARRNIAELIARTQVVATVQVPSEELSNACDARFEQLSRQINETAAQLNVRVPEYEARMEQLVSEANLYERSLDELRGVIDSLGSHIIAADCGRILVERRQGRHSNCDNILLTSRDSWDVVTSPRYQVDKLLRVLTHPKPAVCWSSDPQTYTYNVITITFNQGLYVVIHRTAERSWPSRNKSNMPYTRTWDLYGLCAGEWQCLDKVAASNVLADNWRCLRHIDSLLPCTALRLSTPRKNRLGSSQTHISELSFRGHMIGPYELVVRHMPTPGTDWQRSESPPAAGVPALLAEAEIPIVTRFLPLTSDDLQSLESAVLTTETASEGSSVTSGRPAITDSDLGRVEVSTASEVFAPSITIVPSEANVVSEIDAVAQAAAQPIAAVTVDADVWVSEPYLLSALLEDPARHRRTTLITTMDGLEDVRTLSSSRFGNTRLVRRPAASGGYDYFVAKCSNPGDNHDGIQAFRDLV